MFRTDLLSIIRSLNTVFTAIAICHTSYVDGDRGSTVVKVLCYKSEGRWFDPSWCQWIWPWVDSASNRNEYQEYFLEVKMAGA